MKLKEIEHKIQKLKLEITTLEDNDEKMRLYQAIEDLKDKAYSNLSAYDRVSIARATNRPKADDYINLLFSDFIELHGDRNFSDDNAIIGGLAKFNGIDITVIAQAKGKTLEENLKRNFGMVQPEGYRKALRLAKQAEKFNRPIITLVDTAGAYPGKGAEERGQAQAIAECLFEFSNLKVPVLAVVLSEGGSGGALALSVADRIVMLENAVYSILSPEGFASILWKDETRVEEAAEKMKLTANDLKEKGIVDHIIEEPKGGAQECVEYVVASLNQYLYKELVELMNKKEAKLLEERYNKFRVIGNNIT